MGSHSIRTGVSIASFILGVGIASASPVPPLGPNPFGLGPNATPAAMCGYNCRNGGRYIPGPPEVCRAEGLDYCGPSRGGDDDRRGYSGGRDRGPDRRSYGFDEGEYLRCNPDVRRAVRNGAMESGAVHYQRHGRREGRRLSC